MATDALDDTILAIQRNPFTAIGNSLGVFPVRRYLRRMQSLEIRREGWKTEAIKSLRMLSQEASLARANRLLPRRFFAGVMRLRKAGRSGHIVWLPLVAVLGVARSALRRFQGRKQIES